MSQTMPPNYSNSLSGSGDGAPDIVQYWRMIRHRRKFIAKFTVGTMVLAGALSFFVLPKIYESTASLAPQLETEKGLGLSSLLAAAGGVDMAAQNLGISLPGAPATPTDMFLAILKSRVMADSLIKKFNLKEVYEQSTMDKTRKALAGSTAISLTKEKVIKVVVEDEDPQRAADMANFYVSELDRLNQTVNVSKAAHSRKFLQNQLQETKKKLTQAEEELTEFKTKNKAVAMEAQSASVIEAAAAIQGQLMAHQVQLEVMDTYLSPNNPEMERVRSSIDELRKQLVALESGKSGKGMLRSDRLNPAITAVPAMVLQYGRLLREAKVQETLFTLISSEYEQARYSEARDTPTVNVLDPAVPAELKSRPITTLNALLGGIMGMIVSVLLAFWLENRDRKKAGSIEMELEKAA